MEPKGNDMAEELVERLQRARLYAQDTLDNGYLHVAGPAVGNIMGIRDEIDAALARLSRPSTAEAVAWQIGEGWCVYKTKDEADRHVKGWRDQGMTCSDPRPLFVGHPSPQGGAEPGERIKRLWQDLLEKDDRTSPAEYPDMALITFNEFAAAITHPIGGTDELVERANNGHNDPTLCRALAAEVTSLRAERDALYWRSEQAMANSAEWNAAYQEAESSLAAEKLRVAELERTAFNAEQKMQQALYRVETEAELAGDALNDKEALEQRVSELERKLAEDLDVRRLNELKADCSILRQRVAALVGALAEIANKDKSGYGRPALGRIAREALVAHNRAAALDAATEA